MQVKKRFLARLPWVYAITTLELEGRTWCLAASELEGEGGDCLLIDPDTGAVHTVWTGPGGVMSLVPIPGEAGAFLSIDEFYPVFQLNMPPSTGRYCPLRAGGSGWTRPCCAGCPTPTGSPCSGRRTGSIWRQPACANAKTL